MKLEVQIASLTQELQSIKQDFRTTSENCGKTKNQVRTPQLNLNLFINNSNRLFYSSKRCSRNGWTNGGS